MRVERMSKKAWLAIAVLFLLLATGAGFAWSLQQPPQFYEQALESVPPAEVRREVVKALVEQTLQLVEEIERSDRWSEQFTEQQINSWLAEEFDKAEFSWMPRSVRDPRVKLDDGTMHLAFRIETKRLQGVVSCELKPWVSGPNQIAVAIRFVRLGLVPISMESLVQRLAGRVGLNGWLVTWQRESGHDVVVVNLDRGEPVQPILETIELEPGVLRIAGTRGSLSSAEPQQPVSSRQSRTRFSARLVSRRN